MRDTCNEVMLFDLDGTVADTSHRFPLSPTVDPNSSWARYAQACTHDTPIASVVGMLKALYPFYLIHIVSGRDGSARDQTIEWLERHDIPWDRLTMRALDNEDSNADIKVRYANSLKAEGLVVHTLFDDWHDTVQAMHMAGYNAILVANMKRLEPDAGNTFSGDITSGL